MINTVPTTKNTWSAILLSFEMGLSLKHLWLTLIPPADLASLSWSRETLFTLLANHLCNKKKGAPNKFLKSTSWWLNQATWKIWIKILHFTKLRGENSEKNNMKMPPTCQTYRLSHFCWQLTSHVFPKQVALSWSSWPPRPPTTKHHSPQGSRYHPTLWSTWAAWVPSGLPPGREKANDWKVVGGFTNRSKILGHLMLFERPNNNS